MMTLMAKRKLQEVSPVQQLPCSWEEWSDYHVMNTTVLAAKEYGILVYLHHLY